MGRDSGKSVKAKKNEKKSSDGSGVSNLEIEMELGYNGSAKVNQIELGRILNYIGRVSDETIYYRFWLVEI